MTDPGAWAVPPQYEPPGLSIRATFHASDGSRPQELTVEWRDDPGEALTMSILEKIAEIAASGQVQTAVERAGEVALTYHDPADAVTEIFPRPYCRAQGPGHDTDFHTCVLVVGHPPVEPEGRAHRCGCGGLFATEEEVG